MKEKFLQYLKNPLYVGIAAGVLGFVIGWFLFGWVIWPVSWYDAAPSHLREDLKADYARMAIDSYSQNKNQALAQTRIKALGSDAMKFVDQIAAKPGTTNPAVIEEFRKVISGQVVAPTTSGTKPAATPVAGVTQPAAGKATPTPAPQATGGSSALLFLVLLVVLLGLGGVLVYLLVFRNKKRTVNPFGQVKQVGAVQPPSAAAEIGNESPIAQYMTAYKLGVDLYDDSFSIDAPTGEFLGECGVGISDTIGVGDPKKVTAFEVWLFDKNDIQTITKVLMSEYAFNDPTTTQRLASKGEPILIRSGEQIVLETATLQLVARVVDMQYGQGALPANSFFDHLTLELAIWPKIRN